MKRLKFIVVLLFVLTMVGSAAAQDNYATAEELADPDGQFVTINDASIYYIDRGAVDAPAVILVHGFGGSTFSWRVTLDVLAASGLRAVALDLPPFGLSDKSPDIAYGRQAFSDYIAGLMDELGIETAALVGHSMGGGVIADFALRYPQRVRQLVFVAGSVPLDVESDNERRSSTPVGLLARLDPESPMAATTLRLFLTPEVFIDIMQGAYYDPGAMTEEAAAGYQLGLQIEGWEKGLLAFMAANDSRIFDSEALAALDVPTLLIWGEEDSWVPIQNGEALRDILPGALWITYPAVGHLPMEENSQQFNQDLLTFLQEN